MSCGWALVGWLVLAAGEASGRAVPRPVPERIDGVVALVDGAPIFRSELTARVRPLLDPETSEPEALRREREVLEQMIEETLVALDAARLGLRSSEAELAAAIAAVKQMNGMDAAQLEAQVHAAGLTFAEYEAMLLRQIVEQKWLQWRTAAIDPYLFADEGSRALAYEAERRRLIAGLRERAFIEVRW